MEKSSISKDTAILTTISVIMQICGLFLNIFITNQLGETAIGITSLIFSFFAFALILSNGNIFTATSRFVSEEIGKGYGNVEKIMSYCLIFSITLSLLFSICIFIFATKISVQALHNADSAPAIRLMAMALPLATIGSCLKGYFNAKRSIIIPCFSQIMEFIVKASFIGFFIAFFIKQNKLDVLTAISISIIAGEMSSCIYLSIRYAKIKQPSVPEKASIPSFKKYLIAIFPIVISAYIFVILSSANEALVPITLLKYSGSSDTALSEYGIFEGIIMPILYFPSVFIENLSSILIPEVARENSAGNIAKIRIITKKYLTQGFTWSILITSILLILGDKIGSLACDNPLVGQTLKILCPVIPFIYLEMLLEGILKGMGKQNFSTINSAAEYVIRILCVVIFIPAFGFGGIIISYFSSNIICNIVRITAVLKTTSVQFDFMNFIFIPIFSALVSCKISNIIISSLKIGNTLLYIIIYLIFCIVSFYLINIILTKLTNKKL